MSAEYIRLIFRIINRQPPQRRYPQSHFSPALAYNPFVFARTSNDNKREGGGNTLKKPIIGIAGSLCAVENGPIPGTERSYVNDDYVKAVERAGGVPILLPVVKNEECILAQMENCSGFLFPGGQDIHPECYAAEPRIDLKDVNLRVDEYQLKLVRRGLESGKPILGICRGHQLLNVACGGTLMQDLSEAPNRCVNHKENDGQSDAMHRVTAASYSLLENLLGSEFWVNSKHHQAIRDLGAGLRVIATAADGLIEAVMMDNRSFVLGVQWHPERMVTKTGPMMILFERLVTATIKA
jgi:putative glutamine amidotransferase